MLSMTESRRSETNDDGPLAVFTQDRRTSATLQACATQPRAVNGDSASKISPIVPKQKSSSAPSNPSRKCRAVARSSGWTRSHASMNGPISQAQTVP